MNMFLLHGLLLFVLICGVVINNNIQSCDCRAYITTNKGGYTWSDANSYCWKTYQSQLATIESSDDHSSAIAAMSAAGISNKWTWIGLTKESGSWEWTEYGASSPISYTNWDYNANQPSGDGDCAMIWNDEDWNDAPCTTSYYFLCNCNLYIGVSQSMTWNDADSYCQSTYGTHLATITTDEESQCAYQTAYELTNGNLNVYIGLYQDNNNDWQWIDGTSYDSNNGYTNWNPNQPDRSSNGCGEYECASGECNWNDIHCDDTQYFLCNAPYINFMAIDNSLSWSDADDYCETTFGTSLATINSIEEQNYAINAMNNVGLTDNDNVWFGFNDIYNEGTFTWIEDSSLSVLYTNWESGEPNNAGGSEDCSQFRSGYNYQWNDATCSNTYPFVCNVGYYIAVTTSSLTWSDANDYCETNFGTSLATINSEIDLQNAIDEMNNVGLTDYNNVWIGLNDIDNEGTFQWAEDSSLSVSYTNWNSGEPNNSGNEDCVHFKTGKNYQWNDQSCNSQYLFLCNA